MTSKVKGLNSFNWSLDYTKKLLKISHIVFELQVKESAPKNHEVTCDPFWGLTSKDPLLYIYLFTKSDCYCYCYFKRKYIYITSIAFKRTKYFKRGFHVHEIKELFWTWCTIYNQFFIHGIQLQNEAFHKSRVHGKAHTKRTNVFKNSLSPPPPVFL